MGCRPRPSIKRSDDADRFPADFSFVLTAAEKLEVVTNCDHLGRFKFSPVHPRAFTEHGALMAANILNSPRAISMSVYVIRAFVKMREEHVANAAIFKRLAEIDKSLLIHDAALREIFEKLSPLLVPPPTPTPPKPEIGFHVKENRFHTARGNANFLIRNARGLSHQEREGSEAS
jgi:hypothetical protein